jgi:hypothetical protein
MALVVGVLSAVIATCVLAAFRWVWNRRRAPGSMVATHGPPSSRSFDATVRVEWRGEGAAWRVLALPFDDATRMARGKIQAHVLRDGDGFLEFQLCAPAKIALLWRPGQFSKATRGHLLDTAAGGTRAMTRREVRAYLAR